MPLIECGSDLRYHGEEIHKFWIWNFWKSPILNDNVNAISKFYWFWNLIYAFFKTSQTKSIWPLMYHCPFIYQIAIPTTKRKHEIFGIFDVWCSAVKLIAWQKNKNVSLRRAKCLWLAFETGYWNQWFDTRVKRESCAFHLQVSSWLGVDRLILPITDNFSTLLQLGYGLDWTIWNRREGMALPINSL